MARKRVAITGMGIVTPLGNTLRKTWTPFLNGKSAIKNYGNSGFSKYYAKVDWDDNLIMNTKLNIPIKHLPKFAKFSIKAALEAIDQSKLLKS